MNHGHARHPGWPGPPEVPGQSRKVWTFVGEIMEYDGGKSMRYVYIYLYISHAYVKIEDVQ